MRTVYTNVFERRRSRHGITFPDRFRAPQPPANVSDVQPAVRHKWELLNYSAPSILGPLPPQVSSELVKDGLYTWYTGELASLKERLNGSRTTNQDRGSRILSYYRLLKEYETLSGVWAIRTASAQATIHMTAQQKQLQQGKVTIPGWTPQTDVGIAQKVLLNRKY